MSQRFHGGAMTRLSGSHGMRCVLTLLTSLGTSYHLTLDRSSPSPQS